jgi:hypothetical protein
VPFHEQIVAAAKYISICAWFNGRAIATATSALVISASHAQREQIAAGLIAPQSENYIDDTDWSTSLVAASKIVAAATNNLCEAANASVQVRLAFVGADYAGRWIR